MYVHMHINCMSFIYFFHELVGLTYRVTYSVERWQLFSFAFFRPNDTFNPIKIVHWYTIASVTWELNIFNFKNLISRHRLFHLRFLCRIFVFLYKRYLCCKIPCILRLAQPESNFSKDRPKYAHKYFSQTSHSGIRTLSKIL